MSQHLHRTTIDVDVFIPDHAPRKRSSLFVRTRKDLIEREAGCYVCGKDAEESGVALEAHHHPIEWCMAGMIDWDLFRSDCEVGIWGKAAQAFDWSSFCPSNPYTFVDDMRVNGMLLCKDHHTCDDQGIHMLPFPIWIAQKYGKDGYRFAENAIIDHAETAHA